MLMINNTTAVALDTDDLQTAVSSDNGIEHVYFGANITLSYGITIYPGKASIIFDGTYNGVTYTFTDINNSSLSDTIGIRSPSNITITFQNINLVGRNFFGIPYVPNNADYSGVSTIYHKVTYSGTQITHNPYGLTRYTDCNIIVNNNEVGEVCRLEIGGVTNITKTNRANAVFWFYGNNTNMSYFKILSGANVTIDTAHYFMYEHFPPAYSIEPGGSLTLNTNSGISYDSGHTVASFLVGENASFIYTQAINRGHATIYLEGALTADEGAIFYMQADFVNSNRLIWFTDRASGLYLNNPRSFALYNRGSTAATAFSFAFLTPFVFVGNQVNIWDTPTAFPGAGSFEDEPLYKWNRPSYSQFRITGRAGDSQTIIDSHDFTSEELEQMSSPDDLQLHLAIVFSEGNLPLSVNRIVIGTKRITGKTAKNARVRALCDAIWSCPDCDADDTGIFSATPDEPVPSAEMFTITSNTPFLLTALVAESQEEGGLSIIEASESIQFSTHPMEEFTGVILPRKILDSFVTVLDERAEKTQWVIWAKITGPLRTPENDTLDNAVIFAHEDEGLITLGTEYVPVHTDGPYLDIDDVLLTWAQNRGVLARITVPIRSGRRYSTQLDWVVYPIGLQPEGGR